MRYLILINQNPHAFDGLTDEQLRAFGRRHLELSDELMESGELIASEGLANSSRAHTVSVRDGETVTDPSPSSKSTSPASTWSRSSRSRGRLR